MHDAATPSTAARDDADILCTGTKVLDRYVLEERIGGGGMGEVWRARHLVLDCPVAIKASLSRNARAVQRFEQEARIGASLHGPNLCRVFDAGSHRGVPLLVMDYLQGQSLAERLSFGAPLPTREVVAIVSQVARALSQAHEQNVIHRDIKPSNIFLECGGQVRLLDFGVAKDWGAEQTASGDFLGTPQYLSPEQVANPKDVGPTSDLWALALIAYECVVGKRVFAASSPAELVERVCKRDLPRPSDHAAVPPGFDAWFAAATRRDPRQRFPTAAAFAESLEEALRSPTPREGEAPTLSDTDVQSSERSNRWPPVVIAGIATLLLTGLGLWLTPFKSTTDTAAPAPRPAASSHGAASADTGWPLEDGSPRGSAARGLVPKALPTAEPTVRRLEQSAPGSELEGAAPNLGANDETPSPPSHSPKTRRLVPTDAVPLPDSAAPKPGAASATAGRNPRADTPAPASAPRETSQDPAIPEQSTGAQNPFSYR